jgi:hypothetical protein
VIDGSEVVGIHHRTGAEILHEGNPVLPGEGSKLGRGRFRGEALKVKIRAMDLEDECGAFGKGSGVILQVGLVGGTDLHEPGSGTFKDFGDAEPAPDLDQFAATDDDLVLFRRDEGAEGEDEGGGTVVDGSGGFGFEEDG